MAAEATLVVSPELVSFAGELADAAGAIIRQYWRKPIDVISKDEPGRPVAESPVTIADREAEAAMRKLIEARYPSHGIYGEELGHARLDAEFVWVLDPIDGTKSFITGKPLFGTLVALVRFGKPVLGIIDQPVLRERWLGANGCTTFNGSPARATGAKSLSEAMMYATTPHMFAPGLEETRFGMLRDLVKRPLYGCDCYAYGLLASGFGADLVVEADLGIYDYCALVPVVNCAGGKMTDWRGEELTIQSHGISKGRVVAAANDELWKQALEVLQDPPAAVACEETAGAAAPMRGRPMMKKKSLWPPLLVPSLLLGAATGGALAWLAMRKSRSR
eukprot:TRINITY_DN105390_c0_g1_i1.p1 TRINITY_DN105390_c0_g1~~TRINITY_DN105390_c0_g1_i1.p1  ORF type:complete len:343 (-),score=62.66 TRINITY_DN105390_c0_g1_i1:43-1041(-)